MANLRSIDVAMRMKMMMTLRMVIIQIIMLMIVIKLVVSINDDQKRSKLSTVIITII